MTTLNVSVLDNPLQPGDYVYLERAEIGVSQDSTYRGESLNRVVEALNRSFDSQSELWRAKIQETYRAGDSNIKANLDRLQAKISRHNSSWCVWFVDWVHWFLSFIAGSYQSNQFIPLQMEKLHSVWAEEGIRWCQGYEAQETGVNLSDEEARPLIQRVRAVFNAPMPDSYNHPSHLLMEQFREEVKKGVFEKIVPLKHLLYQGKNLSTSKADYERFVDVILNHIELAVYLKTMKEINYNVGFCGDINRLLYAYLNFSYKWPEETGRPQIEMVTYEYTGIPPIIPGGNHAILLIGRDPKKLLEDHSTWNSEVQVVDAYEVEEELQTYAFNTRLDRGTLDNVLKMLATPTRLLTNEPINWDLIPLKVRPTLARIHADACFESQKVVRELLMK